MSFLTKQWMNQSSVCNNNATGKLQPLSTNLTIRSEFKNNNRIEVLFAKTNEHGNVNFLQNSPLGIRRTYAESFLLTKASDTLLIWCETATSYFFKCLPRPRILLIRLIFDLITCFFLRRINSFWVIQR